MPARITHLSNRDSAVNCSVWRREEHKPPLQPGEGLEPEQGARIGVIAQNTLRSASQLVFG